MKLQIHGLTKEYEGRKVLDIEQLEIEEGSITGIIGPNGAGKSTLLNILGKLDSETSGRVSYTEEGIPLKECAKKITLVFQNPYLIRTTVEKNIAYPLKLRGWSEEDTEKRVSELTRELGLEKLRTRKSWQLSGGEVQKVALARALSFRPKLLLMDEPTASIDPATTGEIERMLEKINREEGTTILLVTHNLSQAKRICHRLVFLNKGQLVETGGCQEIFTTLSNPITRRFVEGELLI